MHDRPQISAKATIVGVKEWRGFHGMVLTQWELKQLSNKQPRGNTSHTAEVEKEWGQ